MKKLSILQLSASIAQWSGGLGRVVIEVTRHLRMRGQEATIWCTDSIEDVSKVIRESNIAENWIKNYPIIGPSLLCFSPSMLQSAISKRASLYHIVHQHSIWTGTSLVTKRWRAFYQRPTVVSPHGTLESWTLKHSAWKKKLAAFLYEKNNLGSASCLHATSEDEIKSFRRFGLRNPIALIPNGIPDSWLLTSGNGERFRNKYCISHNKRLILFLSRLTPKKGLPLLFDAMDFMRNQLTEWYVVIAGPDEREYRRELEDIVNNKLNLADMIRFVGPIYGEDKRNAFDAADIFVLPTYSENFAVAVAEALGAGVPVLTTRGTPWSELETYRCGWWVEVTTDAIRDSLLRAIQCSKKELSEMGQRGKALISRKYTWSEIAKKYLNLYEWLLGRSERPEFVVLYA